MPRLDRPEYQPVIVAEWRRKPSLVISDGINTLLVHCFAGCDPRDVLAELRRRGFVGEAGRRPRQAPAGALLISTDDNDARRQRQKATWLWSQRHPPIGSPAEAHLRSRGYTGIIPPNDRLSAAVTTGPPSGDDRSVLPGRGDRARRAW
jgi:hypothetical protein